MKPLLSVLWLLVIAGEVIATSSDAIPWRDAQRYVGTEQVVEGKVLSARREGNVLRLTFDTNPNSFSVALIAGLLSPLPADPQAVYAGRTVRASGKIRRFQGAFEMVIRDPGRIIIVEAIAEPVLTPAVRLEDRVDELEERVNRLEEHLRVKHK